MGDRSLREERGGSYVEYAFLVVLIAVACLVTVAYFGHSTADNIDRSGGSVAEAFG